jgi:superoxide dismutase
VGTRLLPEIPEPSPDYIKAFWDVVNWDEAAARFAAKK